MTQNDRTFPDAEQSIQAAHEVIAASLAAQRDRASNIAWLRLSLITERFGRGEAETRKS